jgi:hypothetical protein
MLQAFTRPNRRLTIGLFVLCSGLAIAAALVGLADNPPGLLLALLAGMAAVAAFVHPWRTVNQFWYLAFYSVLGLVLFGVLHNVFEALAHHRTGALSKYALEPLAVTTFLVAIFVCPAAFLVGIIGTLITFIRSRRHPPGSAA